MKPCLSTCIFLLLFFGLTMPASSQYGYSEFAEIVAAGITDSSLSLADRQISGDTTVFIGGMLDSIKTRHWNYPGNVKAAQYILEKFQSYGLDAAYQHYDNDGYNVIGTKTGTVYPDEQFIICAHYDDMPNGVLAPGADDNGSGTAAVLEAARILSSYTFDYTLKFITFDEEEQGMVGSRAYADTAYKYGEVIKGVLNLDMIGWDGNSDYEFSISANTASMPLLADFTDILRIFQPVLSPHHITATNSDHSRFWDRGYAALLAIEEYPGDFLPYYHTTNDLFENINRPFYLALTRGAISALATMGRNYKMNLAHQPDSSSRFTGDRTVKLLIDSPHQLDTGVYRPRCYYKVDYDGFNFINAFRVSGDTFSFSIPGQAPGHKISYYFAARDSNGEYAVTLPESGKGIEPPGFVPPPVFYSYYILADTTVTICATGFPVTIPGNQIIYKVASVPFAGQLLDVNVKLSINHTYDKDINLYLVSPSGREVMLSTKNGISLDNYTNTVFDDEAALCINQGRPPFTGLFRPEQPLALFDDTVTNGNWSLKIRNAGATMGSLNNFCLVMTFADNDLYVDASRPVSGNGRSWATALKTITEATLQEPQPGSAVFIKPGTYPENITITSNGQEIVPLKTGISLSDKNKVQFPAGTDLSGINLASFPGEYYAFIYRSRNFNNGFYQVKQVNDAGDYIRVDWDSFLDETGVAGDSGLISAMVCRPVIYSKYAPDPENERVIADAGNDPGIKSILYIGDSVGNGNYDALPANFNIISGIDLTGAAFGRGMQVQGSSYNIVADCKIYETNGIGIVIDGNDTHPAFYNMFINNLIFNTPPAAIFIGADEMPVFNNHSYYNHFIGNDIYHDNGGAYPQLEKGIIINDNNRGTVIQNNVIHDFSLPDPGSGALEIRSGTGYSMVNANIFKNIGKTGEGTFGNILVQDNIPELEICNNLLYNSTTSEDNIYAFLLDGTGHESSRVVHNTIYNMNRGFLLEDYGEIPGFDIINNIIIINDVYYEHLGYEGRFNIGYNLYADNPAPMPGMPYFNEPGRQIGEVNFVNSANGNFQLSIMDEPAICNGTILDGLLAYDGGRNFRDTSLPDIGAFELENKIVWTGLLSQYWSVPGNWNLNALPANSSNVVIKPSAFSPLVDLSHVTVKGILLKAGSLLNIPQDHTLEPQGH